MLTVAKSRCLSHASVRRNVTSVSQSTLNRRLSFLVSIPFCFSTARAPLAPVATQTRSGWAHMTQLQQQTRVNNSL